MQLTIKSLRRIIRESLAWMGIGCDVCGFGTVENVDEFDPMQPCPDCGNVMECVAGSQPEEMYEHELADDEANNSTATIVDDKTKRANKKYFKSMGLSTH